jgi:hypothetical protein
MGETRYLHDCEECVFLGVHEQYDLYFCAANPTVIARYGTEGDYLSGLALVSLVPVLAIAAGHALDRGLITASQVPSLRNS